ncbi:MAG: hypothetical protein ACYSU6_03380 [Planctomycetota bacterium]|jgi:hypothetical protein
MVKKGGNFFEQHVEKIVLAVVGLVCLWLLITRVLISPTYVRYDDEKLGAGGIDGHILKEAELLEDRLNRKAKPKEPYARRVDDFGALVGSSISNVDVSLAPPLPPTLDEVRVKGRYRIPSIGQVEEVAAEHIKAVAYVPTEVIDEDTVYGAEVSEPNDIDLVTVEAKFGVAELYERFNESFAGDNIPEEWRDPCLGVPVFAAVQLKRQELLSDGSWSDWKTVPRPKTDHRRKMFEVIEDIEDLPAGGVKVRLLQFDDAEVRMDLLQPEAYQIASAKEEWFPPSLHKEYVEYQREIDAKEKREAKAAEREGRKEERTDRRTRTPRGRTGGAGMGMPGGGGGPFGGGGGGPFGGGGGMPMRRQTPTRRRRVERDTERDRPERTRETTKTTLDVYQKFDEILMTREKDLAKMEEPLVVWAHDDTVEPKKSYRYKVRLGVFNPVAGTNQFSDEDKYLNEKVILWSEFSDLTEPVDIPGGLYFFPLDIQEATETVTVQVCRYVLGYWYSKNFLIKRGEVIGEVSEYKATDEEAQEGVTVPETVDYATRAVMVDVMPVNDWSGGKNLRARHYFNMLYSFDGTGMEHTPIKSRYWAEDLQVKFNEIKKAEKEPKERLKDWGTKGGLRRRIPRPGIEGGPPGFGPPGFGPPGFGPPGYGPPGYGPGGR